MSDLTTLHEPGEFYTLLGVVGRGYEVKILANNHQFALTQDGQAVIVRVDDEEHRFIGCTEQEIREAMDEWRPGQWA